MSPADHYTSAWMPGDLDEDEAADLALDWFRAVDYTGDLLLLCNALGGWLPEALRHLPVLSPRSRQRLRHRRGNGVLALHPSNDTLETAESLAFDGALCVWLAEDVSPWVVRTGAVNLADPGGEPLPMTSLPEDVTKTLDSILFFGGRNGFIGAGEKEHTIRSLRRLIADGHRLAVEDLVTYLRASGKASERGVKHFSEYYEGLLAGKIFQDYARRPI